MRGEPEAKIRGRCAQLGFPNVKADTKIALLSGGEKARLLMGLASFNGPHLLILDEPTNHLDIDSRAALIDAINEYQGAVILVSHDRYLLDACADRLWVVGDGRVASFDGTMDDYKRLVLSARSDAPARTKAKPAENPETPAPPRPAKAPPLKKRVLAAEEKIAKFQDLLARVDKTLATPEAFSASPGQAAQLARQRRPKTHVRLAFLDSDHKFSRQCMTRFLCG
jgi:ATP-binding cassette subfamily F protein 3